MNNAFAMMWTGVAKEAFVSMPSQMGQNRLKVGRAQRIHGRKDSSRGESACERGTAVLSAAGKLDDEFRVGRICIPTWSSEMVLVNVAFVVGGSRVARLREALGSVY